MDVCTIDKGIIYIINEGNKYTYGTKQRITSTYVANKIKEGYNELIYAGPVNAMGAFALARGCIDNGIKCTLFLVGNKLSPQALEFPDMVTIHLMKMDLHNASIIAEKYVKDNSQRFLVPFGINDHMYKNLLKISIENDDEIMSLNPKRIWIAVGSGTLLSILLEIFPNTIFHAVQVGKSLNVEELHDDPRIVDQYRKRIYIYWAPEKFNKPAKIKPPYSSLINYDAKIWQFVLKYGQDKDFVWNVARDFG